MRVVATRLGFYGNRRVRAGTAFDIPDKKLSKDDKMPQAYSSKWMDTVKDSKDERTKSAHYKEEKIEIRKPQPVSQNKDQPVI